MTAQFSPSRRKFLAVSTAASMLALAGCAPRPPRRVPEPRSIPVPYDVQMMYAAITNEPYAVPAVNLSRLNPAYYRAIVPDPTGERPGTLVVDTATRYLYLVRDDGYAMRYGIGIGRDGFAWSGQGYIAFKKAWPTWTPPSEMIDRQPELEEFRNGMAPGPMNPLGARALYIFSDGKDTLYRLHGNPDETSIGRAVSSGCVRLLQQDVIDLYARVPNDTKIVVR